MITEYYTCSDCLGREYHCFEYIKMVGNGLIKINGSEVTASEEIF